MCVSFSDVTEAVARSARAFSVLLRRPQRPGAPNRRSRGEPRISIRIQIKILLPTAEECQLAPRTGWQAGLQSLPGPPEAFGGRAWGRAFLPLGTHPRQGLGHSGRRDPGARGLFPPLEIAVPLPEGELVGQVVSG